MDTSTRFRANGLFAFGVLAASALLLTACGERPPIDSIQLGYRGLGMEQNVNPRLQAELLARNVAPESLPAVDAGGPRASEVYQNVQVLGDLSVGEFNRVMAAITAWVSPNEGCVYCHKGEDLAVDDVYTKVVSRQMIKMTRNINANWTAHVGQTGVTCYTCHKGKNVPENSWYAALPEDRLRMFTGWKAGQNSPSPAVDSTSLPNDPFSLFLASDQAQNIRVIQAAELARSDRQTPTPGGTPGTKQTEKTYALMVHMSQGLGVNCTYCHNSRSFNNWEESTPQRVTAWHGIQMVRAINGQYITPITDQFPANRKGPLGDPAKVNCTTCHQQLAKPLNGVSMYKDYPELGPARPAPPPAEPAAAEGEAAPADESGTAAAGATPTAAATSPSVGKSGGAS